jgi:hypothetical protein
MWPWQCRGFLTGDEVCEVTTGVWHQRGRRAARDEPPALSERGSALTAAVIIATSLGENDQGLLVVAGTAMYCWPAPRIFYYYGYTSCSKHQLPAPNIIGFALRSRS